MKSRYVELYRLLVIIIGLLGTATGLSLKKGAHELIEQIAISYDDAVREIHPLLYGTNEDLLARSLMRFPDKVVTQLLDELIIAKSTPLTEEEVFRFFANLAYYYNRQGRLEQGVSILLRYDNKNKDSLLFYFMIFEGHDSLIKEITTLLSHHQAECQEVLRRWTYGGIKRAIKRDKLQYAQTICRNGGALLKSDVEDLFFYALREEAAPEFIPFFLKNQVDINIIKNGKTPLIVAIESKSELLVEELLKHGADPMIKGSSTYGSPLQFAFKKRLPSIEKLLRKYGARY